ncbi:MAG: hypothetical protein GQ535_15660 [Rhodobacteraceae bacterium]|nr:hypothetical protein [Paracoccaceae bacterium]
MMSIKLVAQVLMMNLLHDMYAKPEADGISVWTGLHNNDRRFILRVWLDHDQNKWRVKSPYGDNAEFHLLSDALDKARTLSHKLRAFELV